MTDHLQTIDAALDRGDTMAAAQIAERALAANHADGILYNLVAWLREEQGRFAEAEALLRTALERTPDDPTLQLGLGVVLRKQGQLKAAVKCFEQAIRLDEGWAAPWFERGQTFEKGGALADAGRDYEHAIKLEPDNAPVLAALASLHARQGRPELARPLAKQALALEPGNLLACNALAIVAIEARDHAAAISLLEPLVLLDAGPRDTMVNTLTLFGDALEGVGRYDDAYAAYAGAQAMFRGYHAARVAPEAETSVDFLERVRRALQDAGPRTDLARAAASESPVAQHIFLTGYPRSGTTLAENILASLPDAIAIEERPTLSKADKEILSRPDGLKLLGHMPKVARDAFRNDYWRHAERAAGRTLGGSLFVDMDPFKGARLPVIAELFPAAKVIITRRDPRDVVWSCFHTSFAFNAGTLAFTTLENTARHYAASWTVIEAALDRYPIDWFELRYEHLVRDFDATTQAMCAFLEVPWSEDVRAFDRTAQRRGVSTASASQVRQGLYDGSGGWRRYDRYLAEVAPILDPWIKRFGYD